MFSHHCNFKITEAIPAESGVAISALAISTDEEHGVMPFSPHGLLSITLPCQLAPGLLPGQAESLIGQEFKLIVTDTDHINSLNRFTPPLADAPAANPEQPPAAPTAPAFTPDAVPADAEGK
jgi:hypothetical protein